MDVTSGVVRVITGRNDVWEELVLNAADGVSAGDELDHLYGAKALPRERRSMRREVFFRLRHTSRTRLGGVQTASAERNVWPAATQG